MKDLIEEIKGFYSWLVKFLTNDIWNIKLEDFGKAKRRGIKYLRVALVTIKEAGKDKLGLFSIALTFFSTLSLVPFLACCLAVTSGVGLERTLEELLLKSFSGNEEMVNYVLRFAGNIINDSTKNSFGVVSFVFFMCTIIWLMMNVEKAFNGIWKVERRRSITKRFLYYIGILIVGPFIMLTFLSIYIFFHNVLNGIGIGLEFFPNIGYLLQWIIFYGIVVLAFTIMFKYIPNVKVRFDAAFPASLITALAFVGMQFIYLETQLMVSRMNAVYGAFAAIPLFLIWMNISWTIILIGAEISHANQYVDAYDNDLDSLEAEVKNRINHESDN
ncbi:MAG: YihY/virulence factor BrkB family protein [Bacteroidales bacterium]|nr:YihY/virulence factor BrkB family protein [Bacteroidales bacterium]